MGEATMLRVVTFGARVLVVAVLVGVFVAASSASPPRYVYRDVALVTVTGHGSVVSKPRGINCPGKCRTRQPGNDTMGP